MSTSTFGALDAGEWQAVFAGVAALGALVAAVVAWRALKYFKDQTAEMRAANQATRDQMSIQQQRWEHEQLREKRREHSILWPELDVLFDTDSRVVAGNEVSVSIGFTGGSAVRHVTVAAELERREVVAECVPESWHEIEPDSGLNFVIRASSVSLGDRATLRMAYTDALGALVTFTYPFMAASIEPRLRFERDPERAITTTDDL